MDIKERSVNGFAVLSPNGIVIAKVLVTGKDEKIAKEIKDKLADFIILTDYGKVVE